MDGPSDPATRKRYPSVTQTRPARLGHVLSNARLCTSVQGDSILAGLEERRGTVQLRRRRFVSFRHADGGIGRVGGESRWQRAEPTRETEHFWMNAIRVHRFAGDRTDEEAPRCLAA